jgi:hypothetical protein
MNQIRLKAITDFINFPESGKGQAALRRKPCPQPFEAVQVPAKGMPVLPTKKGFFAFISRGKNYMRDTLFLKVDPEPGQGIGYPVYLRVVGIGKIHNSHTILPL